MEPWTDHDKCHNNTYASECITTNIPITAHRIFYPINGQKSYLVIIHHINVFFILLWYRQMIAVSIYSTVFQLVEAWNFQVLRQSSDKIWQMTCYFKWLQITLPNSIYWMELHIVRATIYCWKSKSNWDWFSNREVIDIRSVHNWFVVT